jgi:hypothetical protein
MDESGTLEGFGRLTFVPDMHWPPGVDSGTPRPGSLLRGCHPLPRPHRV